MPRRLLQPLVNRRIALDELDVDRLHALAGDQAQAGIARGGDQVEPALIHQRHHLVGGAGGLHIDLAAALLFEIGDPVIFLVRLAALDIAGPGHDIELSFALADLLHLCRSKAVRAPAAASATTTAGSNILMNNLPVSSLFYSARGSAYWPERR